ncbi:OLC1v1005728C1 [Oldenlandia corymbosa var. corymbosa]|uniref:OLC1v1005728C1 n=1 Tax=Oldenlandia corymbosa var. corymbosa TaxID=529605 RepID=A0AAV1DFA2_OLDCO|nr:OLC1v1005728C1 [Oldenlandia corymbosa var. corymbosa]
METLLCDAAIENNVKAFREFLREDPLVIDKAMLNCQDMMMNPLHTAALFGNVEFVKEVLGVRPYMCFSTDRFGRIPLHFAIINGKLDVVKEIVGARPLAARERVPGGGNALHLCVKYNQLEALKFLVETIRDPDFVNRKDDDGMTILHLAICDKQIETIKYLIENNVLQVNAKSANGSTPLDLFQGDSGSEIERILELAGAKGGMYISSSVAGNCPPEASNGTTAQRTESRLSKRRDALIVVASLIATMAFQATTNPAGGVWQDGEAVMAHKYPSSFRNFITTNTIAFVSSLSTIMLLISGLPFRNRLFLWALMVIMWITIYSIASTYNLSVAIITPTDDITKLRLVTPVVMNVWSGVILLLFLGNAVRLIHVWLKRRQGIDLFKKLRRQGNPGAQGSLQMC